MVTAFSLVELICIFSFCRFGFFCLCPNICPFLVLVLVHVVWGGVWRTHALRTFLVGLHEKGRNSDTCVRGIGAWGPTECFSSSA